MQVVSAGLPWAGGGASIFKLEAKAVLKYCHVDYKGPY